MAEATADSPSTLLPEELMIEILSRVGLNNPLQLRCVCKLWKSLILDPQFLKIHIYKSVTDDIVLLWAKAKEHSNAFRSQLSKNPVVPQEEEEEDDDDDDDDEEEEDNAADEEEDDEDKEEEEKKDDASAEKHWLMKVIAKLDDILVDIRELKEDLKKMKEDLETIKADMQLQAPLLQQEEEVAQVEDRMKSLKRFLQGCLKLAASSSSHF